jgi:hypothetical protein
MKRIISLIILIIVLTTCGCDYGKQQEYEKIVIPPASLESMSSNSLFDSDVLGKQISSCDDNVKAYEEKLFNKMTITSVEERGDSEKYSGVCSLTINWIDYQKMLNYLLTSNDFQKELVNIKSLSASDSEISDYIYNSVCKLIDSDTFSLSEYKCKLPITKNNKLESNKVFEKYFIATKSIKEDILAKSDFTKKPSDFDEQNAFSKIQELTVGSNELINYGISDKKKSKIALNVIGFETGNDAINDLAKINQSNSSLAEGLDSKIVLVKYNVKNIDSNSIVVSNRFIYFDDDRFIYKSSVKIEGMTSSKTIEPGSSATMYAGLVVPADAEFVYWYDNVTHECFSLRIQDKKIEDVSEESSDVSSNSYSDSTQNLGTISEGANDEN